MGLGPDRLCTDRLRTSGGSRASGRSVVAGLPFDLVRLRRHRIYGGGRSSDGVGHPLVWLGCGVAGRPVMVDRPVGLQASDVGPRPIVRWLELLL